ncbi:MAG: TylF/MycF/NovP-related O-methyltransferase [Vitreimonas sp.]
MFFTSEARTRCAMPCPVCDAREGEVQQAPRAMPFPSSRRIYVHVGNHKTGSTALQRAFGANRSRLAARGIVYPGTADDHHAVALMLQDPHNASPANVEQAARVRAEIAQTPHDVVLSSEGFISVEPVALRAWCGDEAVTIIIYLREQAEAIASQYQQQVKADLAAMSFEAFAWAIVVDHEKLLAPWVEVFGQASVRVRPYAGDVVTDFLDIVEVDSEGLDLSQADPNPSIAGALLELKRRINAAFPGTAHDLMMLTWQHLIDLAGENVKYRGRVAATPAFIEAIRARHRESNARVAETYGLVLPEKPWNATPVRNEAEVKAAFQELVRRNPAASELAPLAFPSPAQAAYRRWRAISSDAVSAYPLFKRASQAAGQRSVVVPEKLQHLFLLIRDELAMLDAQDIVEFGCYRGGSALLMGYALKHLYPHAKLYALDTFSGMPDTDGRLDAHGSGDFAAADLDGFRARAAEFGLDNIVIVQGLIQDTFPTIADKTFGLAHIDVDIYSACKFAQDAVWPRLAANGWLVYDDANAPSCIGATRAAEELMMERRLHSEQVWPHWVFRRAES